MIKVAFFQDFWKLYNQRDRKSQAMRVVLMPKKQNGKLRTILEVPDANRADIGVSEIPKQKQWQAYWE